LRNESFDAKKRLKIILQKLSITSCSKKKSRCEDHLELSEEAITKTLSLLSTLYQREEIHYTSELKIYD